MTARDDITVDITVSPRLIIVADPSVVLTIQDLLDTLREWEQELLNMEQVSIITASGKDDLGGGLAVEITVELFDAIVAFEARGGPTYVQCTISGGNPTAMNTVGSPVEATATTAFTQVVRKVSTSAVPYS